MKLNAPDYYKKFKCIAEKCRHSCCIGWEIDIDSDTLEYYEELCEDFPKNPVCERLRKCVSFGEDAHFILTEKDRCPFLNESGLCDIITQFGEDALCDICADHPRYRNYFSDRTEIGLGLCCEAAGRLILGRTEKTRIITLESDSENESLTSQEEEFFVLREKVLQILQDRKMSIDERIIKMLSSCPATLPNYSNAELADLFLSLERLDSEWDSYLLTLKNAPDTTALPTQLIISCDSEEKEQAQVTFETVSEQLLVYFLLRHSRLEDSESNLPKAVLFTALSYELFRRLCAVLYEEKGTLTLDDIVELARLYSSEVEYSDENINKLMG